MFVSGVPGLLVCVRATPVAMVTHLSVSVSVSAVGNASEWIPAGDILKLAIETGQARFRVDLGNRAGSSGAGWTRGEPATGGWTVPNARGRAMPVAEITKGCTVTFMFKSVFYTYSMIFEFEFRFYCLYAGDPQSRD